MPDVSARCGGALTVCLLTCLFVFAHAQDAQEFTYEALSKQYAHQTDLGKYKTLFSDEPEASLERLAAELAVVRRDEAREMLFRFLKQSSTSEQISGDRLRAMAAALEYLGYRYFDFDRNPRIISLLRDYAIGRAALQSEVEGYSSDESGQLLVVSAILGLARAGDIRSLEAMDAEAVPQAFVEIARQRHALLEEDLPATSGPVIGPWAFNKRSRRYELDVKVDDSTELKAVWYASRADINQFVWFWDPDSKQWAGAIDRSEGKFVDPATREPLEEAPITVANIPSEVLLNLPSVSIP